jgi:hypothetical protein
MLWKFLISSLYAMLHSPFKFTVSFSFNPYASLSLANQNDNTWRCGSRGSEVRNFFSVIESKNWFNIGSPGSKRLALTKEDYWSEEGRKCLDSPSRF